MSLGLLLGSVLKGYSNAQQNKQLREEKEKELKARTTLAEIQLRRMQEEEQQQRAAEMQQKQSKLDRSLVLGDTLDSMISGPNQGKSLSEAIASAQARDSMLLRGVDPAAFGVKDDPTEIQILKDPALFERKVALNTAGASRVDVNTGEAGLGKVPPGFYRPNAAAPGLAPEPGGPAAIDNQRISTQSWLSFNNSANALDRLYNAADSLEKNPNLWLGVGFAGGSSRIPGTPGADVAADIQSLSSQVAFGVLQAMREASKTGGALGAVSEKELALLESNLAALSRAQSPEKFRQSLRDLKVYAADAKTRIKGAYEQSAGLGVAPPQLGQPGPVNGEPVKVTNDKEYGALPSGTVFVGPDGVTRRKP